jgi:hypothetical protein
VFFLLSRLRTKEIKKVRDVDYTFLGTDNDVQDDINPKIDRTKRLTALALALFMRL